MNSNLRLHFLKQLLNWPMRLLDRFLPERTATFPQTQIMEAMFKRMFQAYHLEVAQGVFKEINNFEGDGNFPRFLRVLRKLMLELGEDRYYREWIGLFILLASQEYADWLAKVTPQEIKYWCRAQWYVSPDMLSDEAVNQLKEKLAPDVLAYYLWILASKKYEKVA